MSAESTSSGGPDTFDQLAIEIRRRAGSLSPSHKKLAERVLSDPEEVAFMTVSDLASSVGVNEATVVRFATTLGLKGYPGLTRLCRERLQEQAQMLRRFDNLKQMSADGDGGLFEQSAVLDQANIARTFARIDPASWESAVTQVAKARRVHVMGLRGCHAPAYMLGYLLRVLRDDIRIVTGSVGSLTDDLRRVGEGDCFVAMSIHRYSADTVRAAEWAKESGAHVVAFTDNAGSPLAATAHDTFYIDASSTSVFRSMTAFNALAQALAGGVAQDLDHHVRETILREEQLLGGFGVYVADMGGSARDDA